MVNTNKDTLGLSVGCNTIKCLRNICVYIWGCISIYKHTVQKYNSHETARRQSTIKSTNTFVNLQQ